MLRERGKEQAAVHTPSSEPVRYAEWRRQERVRWVALRFLLPVLVFLGFKFGVMVLWGDAPPFGNAVGSMVVSAFLVWRLYRWIVGEMRRQRIRSADTDGVVEGIGVPVVMVMVMGVGLVTYAQDEGYLRVDNGLLVFQGRSTDFAVPRSAVFDDDRNSFKFIGPDGIQRMVVFDRIGRGPALPLHAWRVGPTPSPDAVPILPPLVPPKDRLRPGVPYVGIGLLLWSILLFSPSSAPSRWVGGGLFVLFAVGEGYCRWAVSRLRSK